MARYVVTQLVGLGLALWLTLTVTVSARSAQIVVMSNNGAGSRITIAGDIELTDAVALQRKTAALTKALVVLRSSGGNAAAGISIGRYIRKKGFLTLVPAKASCASACALAWLGGTRRFMAADARIGFHSAYRLGSGRARRLASANRSIAAYVTGLGLPPQAVDYVTSAPPEHIYWLSLAAARAVGLGARRYTGDRSVAASPQQRHAPLTIQQATDYPGNDIGWLKQSTVLDCLVACSEDTGCKAFTFVTYRNECWLKNETGSAEPRAGVVSGVK